MRIRDILKESLSDWGPNWVHYSKVPYMKVNPKPFHQDPAGIYLFPEGFKTHSFWPEHAYKFIVTLKPNIRVLDFATMDIPQIYSFMDRLGVGEKFNAEVDSYKDFKSFDSSNPKDLLRVAWDKVKTLYGYRQWGAVNAALRKLGYDAIFDDLGVILSNEIQMLVLDPRIIASARIEHRKRDVFGKLKRVMEDVERIAVKYGTMDVYKPVRKSSYGKQSLEGSVKIVNPQDPERNYAWIFVTYDPENSRVIHISLRYAQPHLNAGYGASFIISMNEYEREGLIDIERGLNRVFNREQS